MSVCNTLPARCWAAVLLQLKALHITGGEVLSVVRGHLTHPLILGPIPEAASLAALRVASPMFKLTQVTVAPPPVSVLPLAS